MLVAVAGLPMLFTVMAVLAAAVAVAMWTGTFVPAIAPKPRVRQTILDTTRRLGDASS
jgi:hypothetical protein